MQTAEQLDKQTESKFLKSLILEEICTLKENMKQEFLERPTLDQERQAETISQKMKLFQQKLDEFENSAKRLRKREKLKKIRREVILCKIRMKGVITDQILVRVNTPDTENNLMLDEHLKLNVDKEMARTRLQNILKTKRALETAPEKAAKQRKKNKDALELELNAFLLALVYNLHFMVKNDSYVQRNPEFFKKEYTEKAGFTKKSVFSLLKAKARLLANLPRMTPYKIKAKLVESFDNMAAYASNRESRKGDFFKIRTLALKQLLVRKNKSLKEKTN